MKHFYLIKFSYETKLACVVAIKKKKKNPTYFRLRKQTLYSAQRERAINTHIPSQFTIHSTGLCRGWAMSGWGTLLSSSHALSDSLFRSGLWNVKLIEVVVIVGRRASELPLWHLPAQQTLNSLWSLSQALIHLTRRLFVKDSFPSSSAVPKAFRSKSLMWK